MTQIFLETVVLLAIWNNSDQWHDVASQAYGALRLQDVTLFTTSFVLLECGNAASRKPFRRSVSRLKDQLILNEGFIVPSHDDCEKAWREYDQGHPGSARIVDCVSFVVMRRLGITEAFTNDQHFQDAGFKTLF